MHSKQIFHELKPTEFSSDSFSMLDMTRKYLRLKPNSEYTYSQYFGGDLSRDKAKATLDKLLTANWLSLSPSQPMVNTEFKYAFYNQN